MPAVSTIIAGVGLAIGGASTVMGMKAQRDQVKAQNKAEDARQKAANLDALRRKRAVVREQQMQRSVALSNATAQGAEAGSGLQGAMAGITGQATTNIVGINQQQELGNQVFAANRQASRASSRAATADGLGQLGGALVKNAGTIESVGMSFFGRA